VFTTPRSLLATAATVALAGFAVLGAAAPANAATVNGITKIGICKATGSATNPYTFVYTTTDSLISGHYSADDIVPAFSYTTADGISALFLGQNTDGTVLTAACTPVVVTVSYVL
jgi:hypothetical protein